MAAKREPVDPLKQWRCVVLNRMHWQNMLRGSWRYATPQQFVIDETIYVAPEEFGPPIPEKEAV